MPDLTKLDKVYSDYIRMREVFSNGEVKCCTCDNVSHWKAMDAGHFIRRGVLATRFHEKNGHAQCIKCNRFRYGNIAKYKKFMDETYSTEELDELYQLSQTEVHYMQHEVDEMVQYFKDKIRELNL